MRRPSTGFLVTAGLLISVLVVYVACLRLEARASRHRDSVTSCVIEHVEAGDLRGLSELLRSLPPRDRAIAIVALAMMRHDPSRELVVAYARAESPAVRRSVQYYISRLELIEYGDVAVSCLLDPEPRLRKGAFDAFVMSLPEAKPIMASMAESDPDPECRELAAVFVDSVPIPLPTRSEDRTDGRAGDGTGRTDAERERRPPEDGN